MEDLCYANIHIKDKMRGNGGNVAAIDHNTNAAHFGRIHQQKTSENAHTKYFVVFARCFFPCKVSLGWQTQQPPTSKFPVTNKTLFHFLGHCQL